jgi:predicted HD phosphohydrolase
LATPTVADIFDVLQEARHLPMAGEQVDQLTHALLCAGRAMNAGADSELVVACAFHDIGRVRTVRLQYRGMPHEHAGAAYCAHVFTPRVAWLVGAHVVAKRYMVAVDPNYREALSAASVRSLEQQGGPLTDEELMSFSVHPWMLAALQMRRWDEAAKDPVVPAPRLSDLADHIVKVTSL